MTMSNKKVAVVLASDDRQAFALANVIIGLKKYNEALISRIFIYHDIRKETQDKLSRLWSDRIEFIHWPNSSFLQELGSPVEGLDFSRYPHFIYAKFHIFDYLDRYDHVLWMDSDMLVRGSLQPLLAEADCAWRYGDETIAMRYIKKMQIPSKGKKLAKPNGGFILLNSSNIIRKAGPEALRKECYAIMRSAFEQGVLHNTDQSDEMPFGILQYKYGFSVTESRPVANVFPREVTSESMVIHALGDLKFWKSSVCFFLFPEWYEHHRQWLALCPEDGDKLTLDGRYAQVGEVYSALIHDEVYRKNVGRINYINAVELNDKKLYVAAEGNGSLTIKTPLMEGIFYRFMVDAWGPLKSARLKLIIGCHAQSLFRDFKEFSRNFCGKFPEYSFYERCNGKADDFMKIEKAMMLERADMGAEYLKLVRASFDELHRRRPIRLYWWNHDFQGTYNVGDILSKFIVEKLSGRSVVLAAPSDGHKLCAVGSIINNNTLAAGGTFWGSGMHHADIKFFDADVKFLAVRGPLTRQSLLRAGYKCPEIYGDPALLLPDFYTSPAKKKYKIGVVAHWKHQESIRCGDGALFINILRDKSNLTSFIDDICQCERIISSSLHGIIIANAYGIPAKWFVVDGIPLEGDPYKKFNDYFISVKMPVQAPVVINNTIIDERSNIDMDTCVDLKFDKRALVDAFPYDI